MFGIPCVLFAGGKSSRMGEDKSFLPFGGYETLAEFQYSRLKKLFSHVYLCAKTGSKFAFESDIILDPEGADFAPTAGFVGAFTLLEDDRIMVLSVDTPFVGEEVFRELVDADSGDLDAVIARTPSGSHPMCGIYHRSLLGEMERMLREGDHRLGKMLSASRTRYVMFDDEAPFTNLNHPHEYREAYALYARQNG